MEKSLTVSVLMALLIGVFFVVLFTDRFNGVSLSTNSRLVGNYEGRLTKRSERHSGSEKYHRGSCKLLEPSEDDLLLLGKTVSKPSWASDAKPSVVCYLNVSCHSETGRVSAECSSRSCSAVSVTFKGSNVTKSNLSMKMLAEMIEIMNDMGTVNINNRLLIFCDDGSDSEEKIKNEVKFRLDYLGTGNCASNSETIGSPVHVNIFFFRFLSRHALLAKMKSLAAAINDDFNSEVLDFTKYQSTEWKFQKSLSLFLQGNDIFNISNPSLLTLARDLGFDVKLLNTAIEKASSHEDFLKLISKQGNASCSDSDQSFRKCCLRLFTEDAEIETTLDDFRECVLTEDKNPVFRVSFLNYVDYSRDISMLDDVLTDVIKQLSRRQNSVIFLLSDVGDPIFATLASSLFLQTEPSNPFWYLFIPNRLGGSVTSNKIRRTAKANTKQIISLLDIHETVRDVLYLLSGRDDNEQAKIKPVVTNRRSLFTENSVRCQTLKISPPGLCICENDFALYPNDTIQVALAEVALGLVNNRILDYVTKRFGYNARDLSPLLRGKAFSKVRVRQRNNNVQQRIMDISYVSENTGLTQTLINISVNFDPVVKSCSLDYVDNLFLETHFSTIIRHISRLYSPEKLLSSSSARHGLSGKHFGVTPKEIAIHQRCLVLFKTDFMDAATFETGNVCNDRKYSFTFDSNLLDTVSLVALPVSVNLGPGDFRFLTSFVKSSYLVKHGRFHYETDYEVTYL